MSKKVKVITFRLLSGIWRDVSGDSDILADTLSRLGIIIDDDAQFVRIIKFNRVIEYRAYSGAKITISIYESNL